MRPGQRPPGVIADGSRVRTTAPVAPPSGDNAGASDSLPDQAPTTLIERVHELATAGRYGESLALVTDELSRRSGDGELLFARASTLFDWGRIREARAGFLQAHASGLARTALYLNLAWSSHLLRVSAEAERFARMAIASDPSSQAAHFGLATVLQRLKRYPEAIGSYQQALALTPDFANCAAGIAYCKLEQHEYDEAETWLRRAIDLAPDNPQLWTNLGVAVASRDRYQEAFEALRRAGELEAAQGLPPESVIDHAYTLILTGQDEAVVELLRRHLPQLPDPRAHSHYAFALLTLGQFQEGWAQYEVRWLQEPHLSHRPNFSQPTWAGQNLAGKTILLRAEQGAGDIIQFARYAQPLKALGATVVLQVRPEITQLALGFAHVDHVFAPPTPSPPFDYYVHIMSLPHAFGTDVATIPSNVPYLRVDAVKAQRWAARIGDGAFKVGLVWAGNPLHPRDRFRSIALHELRSLFVVEGVRYFSLQKPPRPEEIANLPAASAMTDLGPELDDFGDTAAVIAALDLVICVDTAVAHLAGALGKPVWLMLPAIGDFRWLAERDDSPWYPTMRLFRQRRIGVWDEVVARVKMALQQAVKTGSAAAPTAVSGSVETPENLSGAPDVRSAAPEVIDPPSQGIARVAETRYGIMQYVPEADPAARSIAWYGEFLQSHLNVLARLVRPGGHVVEAGSGIGAHALSLARLVGPDGHLFLYESHPVAQRILGQNLDVNRVAQCVTLMRRDLGGSTEALRQEADVISDRERERLPGGAASSETVDELLLDRLDLLKINLDAKAAAILQGAGETLWRLRPIVFIATRDATSTTKLAQDVKAFGYRCWQTETPLFDPANFNRRDTDIFAGQSGFALLAIPEEVDVTIGLDEFVEIADKSAANTDAAVDRPSGPLRWLRKLLQ